MKNQAIKILKIVIPVLLGLYICWYFWTSFDDTQKNAFLDVFKRANYFWVTLALIIGLVSHVSRAMRWKYALKPMGYTPSTYSSYNAIMIGYIANLIVPRMGEASRAAVLKGTDNVPFDKGFGTIVAERVIDLVCLILVSGFALLFNLDKIDDLLSLADVVNAAKPGEPEKIPWITYSFYASIILTFAIIGFLWLFKEGFKDKVKVFVEGLKEGLLSILKMKDRWAYLGHTALIWTCYVAMFWVVFYALPFTAILSIDAIMAGFVAGTLGFVVVQGGLGVYPVVVGAIVSFFRDPETLALTGQPAGEDVGFGALVWASQTILIVLLGLISMAAVQKSKKKNLNVNK